ncbi:MAG: Gfo/Idh/MocA family oxidoreductase [Planctomycetaceae bacterium]|nr:Gfo/Idh/MocA family oxidoreductase [Planctomycetaceae bacterium]
MTVKIGLLGAGWFGREAHLRNLLKLADVEVVAASSRSEASRGAVQQIGGDQIAVYADWRQALNHDGLDAVIVALTNNEHHPACLDAFARGLHVLCEKPLGLTIAECDEVIAAANAAGRVLQVGHEMRHQRLYERMKSLVNDGRVGRPRIMWCREYRGPMRPGWRSSEELTGGMLLEKNCHHFDLFHWILEARPVKVAAFGGRETLDQTELLDNAQVLVEYEGGQRSVLEICLFAPTGGDCEIGVVGTNGRIDTKNQAIHLEYHQFAPAEHFQETVPDPDDEAGFQDASGRVDRGIKAELAHFVECCQTGERPLNDGESARWNVAVCLAAQQAVATGQVVKISDLLS